MPRYSIDDRFLQKYQEEIKQGRPVDVQIRDDEEFNWKNVHARLSRTPLEGGEPLASWTTTGAPVGEEWYIEILEELPEEVSIEVAPREAW